MYYIYKIVSKNDDIKDCYIGITRNFHRRKLEHSNNYYNNDCIIHYSKLYSFIRKNGGWAEWKMKIIKKYDNIDKERLSRKKRQYIMRYNATLNTYLTPNESIRFKKNASVRVTRNHIILLFS